VSGRIGFIIGIRRLPLSPISLAFSLTETFETIFVIPLIINNIAIAVMAGIM
jgi:hypothetical protein